ncbi:uncharacterized protein PG986_003652 [Apiospora aurea]|uniref:MYND-type domain-containing protein n=1 Tax=Apiospora aurea TaxID=335848 RepID=A0ABR1QS95_9PEZI
MSTDGVESCIICEKPDSQRCGRCKSAFYCSKACQVLDWPLHKLLCASYGSFDISARPTSDHFLAISFPPEDKKPKPIWVHCPWHVGDLRPYQFPDVGSLDGSDSLLERRHVQYNPVLRRQLEDTIRIAWRDEFLVGGSIPNKSILSITTSKPGRRHDWRGPITAYGTVGLGIDQTHCRDLDMNDFRHITDFFLWYGDWATAPTDLQQPSTTPQHEAPQNQRSHDQLRRRPDHVPQAPAATFLYLCCDPTAEFDPESERLGWGWVPMRWQSCARSVLVVQRDKKPLWPLQAEALSKYCQFEVRPLMSHSKGEYPDEPLSKEAVLAMICRQTFSICW